MKIAIIADSHDHYINLQKAVDQANQAACGVLLHAGDLGAPERSVCILEKFNGLVKMVLGNNDHEIVGLMRKTFELDNFELIKTSNGGDVYEALHEEVRFFMHHYPRIAQLAALSNEYDVCIFGHTHEFYDEIVNNTLLINPGSIIGSRDPASMVIYDTDSKAYEKIVL